MRRIKLSAFMIALLLVITACASNQNKVKVNERQIVAVSVEVFEILEALELDINEVVVGISNDNSSTLLEEYQNLKMVGAVNDLDINIIEALKPTLILAPNSSESELSTIFVDKKIDSAFLNFNSLTGLMQSIEELGVLLEQESQAEKIVMEFKDFIKNYRESVQGKEMPTVLILVGFEETYKFASENSYIGNLVKLAGGINVFGDEYSPEFLELTFEEIMQINPTIILRVSTSQNEEISSMFEEEFLTNTTWGVLKAVENNQVYDLDYEIFGLKANLKYQNAINTLNGIFYLE